MQREIENIIKNKYIKISDKAKEIINLQAQYTDIEKVKYWRDKFYQSQAKINKMNEVKEKYIRCKGETLRLNKGESYYRIKYEYNNSFYFIDMPGKTQEEAEKRFNTESHGSWCEINFIDKK